MLSLDPQRTHKAVDSVPSRFTGNYLDRVRGQDNAFPEPDRERCQAD
jgi:hypothetical protein